MSALSELVIISGKGGCGKTTIAASFASLARNAVIADCDVDAADLHLVLRPRILQTEDFYSGWEARIDANCCTGCGRCTELCRFDAITITGNTTMLNGAENVAGRYRDIPAGKNFVVDPLACEGCGVCADHCPARAITLNHRLCGDIYVSDTDYGPFVHARLGIGAENSGKLVSAVRSKAKSVAEAHRRELVIIDGSPGIGCPVIASLSGATAALIVSEPTPSGLSDLERVLKLTVHFNIPAMVCIVKADLNTAMACKLRLMAENLGAKVMGNIDYDPLANRAQIESRPLVDYPESKAGHAIRAIWYGVQQVIWRHVNASELRVI